MFQTAVEELRLSVLEYTSEWAVEVTLFVVLAEVLLSPLGYSYQHWVPVAMTN